MVQKTEEPDVGILADRVADMMVKKGPASDEDEVFVVNTVSFLCICGGFSYFAGDTRDLA